MWLREMLFCKFWNDVEGAEGGKGGGEGGGGGEGKEGGEGGSGDGDGEVIETGRAGQPRYQESDNYEQWVA